MFRANKFPDDVQKLGLRIRERKRGRWTEYEWRHKEETESNWLKSPDKEVAIRQKDSRLLAYTGNPLWIGGLYDPKYDKDKLEWGIQRNLMPPPPSMA